jgi:hypothetical protein
MGVGRSGGVENSPANQRMKLKSGSEKCPSFMRQSEHHAIEPADRRERRARRPRRRRRVLRQCVAVDDRSGVTACVSVVHWPRAPP